MQIGCAARRVYGCYLSKEFTEVIIYTLDDDHVCNDRHGDTIAACGIEDSNY